MPVSGMKKGEQVMKTYEAHVEVTKELLDSIKVGDLIKINDWKKPLRVMGVSENYFVMAIKQFGDTIYSVCEKKKWDGKIRNKMRGGMFHCGRDAWLFGWGGWQEGYDFDNSELTSEYLNSFEKGESSISERNAIPIRALYIKRAQKRVTNGDNL